MSFRNVAVALTASTLTACSSVSGLLRPSSDSMTDYDIADIVRTPAPVRTDNDEKLLICAQAAVASVMVDGTVVPGTWGISAGRQTVEPVPNSRGGSDSSATYIFASVNNQAMGGALVVSIMNSITKDGRHWRNENTSAYTMIGSRTVEGVAPLRRANQSGKKESDIENMARIRDLAERAYGALAECSRTSEPTPTRNLGSLHQ